MSDYVEKRELEDKLNIRDRKIVSLRADIVELREELKTLEFQMGRCGHRHGTDGTILEP